MEHHFWAIAVDWAINIVFGTVALVVALVAIKLCDRIIYKKIDFIEEIRGGNMAAAVAFSTMLGFAALIIAASVK